MKYKTLIYIIFILFVSCNSTSTRTRNANNYGGTLKINAPFIFNSLFPHSIKDQVSSQMISQIYEGLVKFDAYDLSVKPAIASNWKIDSSETTYYFYLHNNVYFHDDACFPKGIGRKVTAQDFVYTYTLLATENENNTCFFGSIDNILGAKDHYFKKSAAIQGLSAINDTTLKIILEKPNPLFLYILASPVASVIPSEAFENYKYKNYIGTGPFFVSKYPLDGKNLILERNPYYYSQDKSGNYLPYLDSIIVSFNGSVVKELSMLKRGELDLVYNINNEHVSRFLEESINLFKGKSPKFILLLSNYNQNFLLQHIVRRDLKGFITNSQNFYDLSKVYFEKPVQDSLLSVQK